MPTCVICSTVRTDLTRHIRYTHRMTIEEYRKRFSVSAIVDPVVDLRRKQTCLRKYGNPNYRNEHARKLSYELYEGGHPLRDPSVRAKIVETMKSRYGVPVFTNRAKAALTCLAKYGVKNPSQNPLVNEKRRQTLLNRYGRVFNFIKPKLKPPDNFASVATASTIPELAVKFNVSQAVVSRWIRELGIIRSFHSIERKRQTPFEIIRSYLEACVKHGAVLSFYEYGKLYGESYKIKIKRLFENGKRYHGFLGKLKEVALTPDAWDDFFQSLNQ